MKTKTTLSLIVSLLISISGLAQSAKDIMIEYDKVSKAASNSLIQKMKLSTCKYTTQQGKMRAAEKARVCVLEIVAKDDGIDNRDSRSVSIVIEPIRDKGIGMLTYAYAAPDKDDDNWLYLSALGKVRRLVSTSESSDESGSFFGSEFTVEDIASRKIEDYTYKLIEEVTYANRPVWVLELIPTPERTKKSKYGKVVLWIDKDRHVILKQELYDRSRTLFKRLTANNVEKINDVWVARKAEMNNLLTRRVTIMELIAIAYNIDVPNDFLTQRTLTDFAYREKTLAQLRTPLKVVQTQSTNP
jgi:hypothetical protein